ncbi:MAG: ATP-grasp domain-containing protein [Acidobacteria bacterium]|nr:ATP-grasp domain-containing protein [Acidobacteriota bacterium]MCB9399346.1 ATP-grasp domain-containing protein [Acidobacteriota bacterium]
MKLLFLSPGYPSENPDFAYGAAEMGIQVYGVGDQPQAMLPDKARKALTAYLQVRSLWDEDAVLAEVRKWVGRQQFDRVECVWEPGMVLAARIREMLGTPGMNVARTLPFRNKEMMKQVLDSAGLRTPRHRLAKTITQCWEFAEDIGFPIILKPIAGAGSADTYRVNNADELRSVLPRLRHVPQVSVEEFVDGDEFTFDTVTINGQIAYYNVAWYRPRPLIARSNEWVSPQVIALRHVDQPDLREGVRLGFNVIKALQFESGFTHMEWYRKADGEVVFGEIGARPPGARQVDQMNFACDIDVFRGWAEAVCFKRFSQNIQRKFNVATVYKRAHGQGTIHKMTGYASLKHRYGSTFVWENLLPIGSRRRDWKQTLVSDGFIMLRHPELNKTCAIADAIGEKLNLYAG